MSVEVGFYYTVHKHILLTEIMYKTRDKIYTIRCERIRLGKPWDINSVYSLD